MLYKLLTEKNKKGNVVFEKCVDNNGKGTWFKLIDENGVCKIVDKEGILFNRKNIVNLGVSNNNNIYHKQINFFYITLFDNTNENSIRIYNPFEQQKGMLISKKHIILCDNLGIVCRDANIVCDDTISTAQIKGVANLIDPVKSYTQIFQEVNKNKFCITHSNKLITPVIYVHTSVLDLKHILYDTELVNNAQNVEKLHAVIRIPFKSTRVYTTQTIYMQLSIKLKCNKNIAYTASTIKKMFDPQLKVADFTCL